MRPPSSPTRSIVRSAREERSSRCPSPTERQGADRRGGSATPDRRATSRAAPAKRSQRPGPPGCAPAEDRSIKRPPAPLTDKAGDSKPAEGGGISVVVTVRDDPDQLAQLLDSLERQTRAPDEVVIVDGGSSDSISGLVEGRREGGLP